MDKDPSNSVNNSGVYPIRIGPFSIIIETINFRGSSNFSAIKFWEAPNITVSESITIVFSSVWYYYVVVLRFEC